MIGNTFINEVKKLAKKGGGDAKVITENGSKYYAVFDEKGKERYRSQRYEDVMCWMEIRIKFQIPFSAVTKKVKRGVR